MKFIAATPLCPLYREPRADSERVDEVLAGWTLSGPEEEAGGWWSMTTSYGYRGWVRQELLVPAGDWPEEGLLVITAPFADLLAGPEVELPVADTLPRGALARPLEGEVPPGWRQAALPDGRRGWLKAGLAEPYCPHPPKLPEERLRARVVERAMSYLGTQYRWGGKSPLGVDCSGLTFMAWFFCGVRLYRDARLVEGYPARPIPPERCQPADLLYFPGHIALYLGEGRYIHATARPGSDGVVINSLDPADPGYRADLAQCLLTGGTVFPLEENLTSL